MSGSTFFGLVLIALGCGMLVVAWHAAAAPVAQLFGVLSGFYAGDWIWVLLTGVLWVFGGAALIARGTFRA
jgi:hypothetical protein